MNAAAPSVEPTAGDVLAALRDLEAHLVRLCDTLTGAVA